MESRHSSGTLRTEDLLSSFASELEWQVNRNADFFSRPENFGLRDQFARLIGEAQDAWNEDGETLANEEHAEELVSDLVSALSEYFAPRYGYFGASDGDGADFGFWCGDVEEIKRQVEFVSSAGNEYPPAEFRGEWLHVNEHGNCTLYVREGLETRGETFVDREQWAIA